MPTAPRKIAIIGYSGSGKSTLAAALGRRYGLPVLHIDTIQFLPGWVIRDEEEKKKRMTDYLDAHPDGWVIDGNYSRLSYERRMEEADTILFLNFNRFACFFRAYGRYRKYRGQQRDSVAEGCMEKFDREFARWILLESRNKKALRRYQGVGEQYPEKFTVIRNQKQLDEYYREHGLTVPDAE